MFTDPQSVTVSGSAKSMPRISSEGLKSTYQSADSLHKMIISHQSTNNGRIRSLVRFDAQKIVENPLTSQSDYDFASLQLVIDRPQAGFSTAEIDAMVAGFKTWLTTTAVTQLVGRES